MTPVIIMSIITTIIMIVYSVYCIVYLEESRNSEAHAGVPNDRVNNFSNTEPYSPTTVTFFPY